MKLLCTYLTKITSHKDRFCYLYLSSKAFFTEYSTITFRFQGFRLSYLKYVASSQENNNAPLTFSWVQAAIISRCFALESITSDIFTEASD